MKKNFSSFYGRLSKIIWLRTERVPAEWRHTPANWRHSDVINSQVVGTVTTSCLMLHTVRCQVMKCENTTVAASGRSANQSVRISLSSSAFHQIHEIWFILTRTKTRWCKLCQFTEYDKTDHVIIIYSSLFTI